MLSNAPENILACFDESYVYKNETNNIRATEKNRKSNVRLKVI